MLHNKCVWWQLTTIILQNRTKIKTLRIFGVGWQSTINTLHDKKDYHTANVFVENMLNNSELILLTICVWLQSTDMFNKIRKFVTQQMCENKHFTLLRNIVSVVVWTFVCTGRVTIIKEKSNINSSFIFILFTENKF